MRDGGSQAELDRTTFERAVVEFVTACSRRQARESVFQGWLTYFLAQPFGWARVYREVHIQATDLLGTLSKNRREAYEAFELRGGSIKGALPKDVAIADCDTPFDCRSSFAREEPEKVGILKRFSIVAELKVVDAVMKPRAQRGSVWRDFQKLALYTEAAIALEADSPLAAYLIIMDNADSHYKRDQIEAMLERQKVDWPHDLAPPIVAVAKTRPGAPIDWFRGFRYAAAKHPDGGADASPRRL